MNQTGISQFDQARIEWAIRLRYSPMPEIDMQMLSSQLNAFRIGELRVVGKTWEVMMERDAELSVNSDKRKADAAGLEWQVVSDGSIDGDRHAVALQYFYENITATKALDQDSTGGVDELVYQTLSALDYYYSTHEILLRIDNPAAKEATAEFRHTPVWFMEARRGYLGYLKHIFDMYGQPCIAGEWLTAVNMGWMRPLTMAYAAKWFSFTDWLIFSRRYGSGFLEAVTDAQKDSPEWTQAEQALAALASDGAVVHNNSVEFKFLDQQAKNQLPFQPVVELIDRLYAKCYRGVDLATGSRGAHSGGTGGEGSAKNPVGSSVQKEESGIFLVRDARWVTGVFNERIDRPMVRYLFGQEPRAWFVLVPPLDDTTDSDLNSVKTLVPMGFKIMLKEAYKRFRWSPPEPGEPCLEAAPVPMPVAPGMPGAIEEDPQEETEETEPGKEAAPGKQPPAPKAPGKKQAPANEDEEETHEVTAPATEDRPTSPAMTDENTPIAPGADSKRQVQTADNRMPTPQVDGAGLWSHAGLAPRGADGQVLPMPSLGYSLPNERLASLLKCGLGNSRAAQALKRNGKAQMANGRPQAGGQAVALGNASGFDAKAMELLIEANLAEFRQINQRLEAASKIEDPDQQKQKLAQILADLDKLESQLHHDPAIGQAIYKILAASSANGIAQAAQERKQTTDKH